MNQENLSIPVICGPTASGKTALSLLLSNKLNIEVISADSRQVYKYMDIGTAKPAKQERDICPHHLIDIIKPDQTYSAGNFTVDVERAVSNIIEKRHIPVVVGGSGLYLKALIEGLFEAPEIPINIRRAVTEELKIKGSRTMYKKLLKVDPESAKKIQPADWKKICRALEVKEATGIPISILQKEKAVKPLRKYFIIYMDIPREELYRRINKRVVDMVRNGLLDEVKGLLKRGYNPDLNSMKTVGYQESIAYLHGKQDKNTAIELIQKNTRHFAKRQVTWFKKTTIDIKVNGQEDISFILENLKKRE